MLEYGLNRFLIHAVPYLRPSVPLRSKVGVGDIFGPRSLPDELKVFQHFNISGIFCGRVDVGVINIPRDMGGRCVLMHQ